ncbi:MAG: L,D-transpeptidase family protein [Actinomycetota bacterium]
MGGWSKLSWASVTGIVAIAALPFAFLIPALSDAPAPAGQDGAAVQPVSEPVAKAAERPSVMKAIEEAAAKAARLSANQAPVVFPERRTVVVPQSQAVPQPLGQAPVAVPNSAAPDVLALEQRLSQLGYLVGKVDGTLDGATKHGITAFQKVEGLERTGRADGATLARLQSAVTPPPRFTSPPDHFEVDIPRQVVLVVRGGRVSAIVPTSTGNNKLFTSQGYTRRAVTPNGQFQINFKRNGWRDAPLGRLYRPAYFNGGIAFHGSTSIPTSPASHGCIRLPMAFADWFADNAPVGMTVYVYGGPTGANPQPQLDAETIASSAAAPAGPGAAPVVPAPAPVPGDPLSGLLGNLLPQ